VEDTERIVTTEIVLHMKPLGKH